MIGDDGTGAIEGVLRRRADDHGHGTPSRPQPLDDGIEQPHGAAAPGGGVHQNNDLSGHIRNLLQEPGADQSPRLFCDSHFRAGFSG
jgi:hypothetical protein